MKKVLLFSLLFFIGINICSASTDTTHQYILMDENVNEIKYYQVAQSIKDDKVRNRKLRSLESIPDSYEKLILIKKCFKII